MISYRERFFLIPLKKDEIKNIIIYIYDNGLHFEVLVKLAIQLYQGNLFVTALLIYCHLTFFIAYHSIISIFAVFSKPVIELIQLIFSAQRNSNIKL